MKRRGFIKSIIGGVAGFVGGKIMADEKPKPEYKTVKPNDDGWVILQLDLRDVGIAFKMRFKPCGNWDIINKDRVVLIDYVHIEQPRENIEFTDCKNEISVHGISILDK